MKYLIAILAATVMMIGAAVPALAGTSVRMINVLVIAEDSDPASVPLRNNINTRVVSELREQMRPHGYRIMDLDAMLVSLEWDEMGNRVSRAEKIALAQAACEDGDLTTCPRMVVFVSARAGIRSVGVGAVASVRLMGEVVDTANNTSMGSFQPVRDTFTAPAQCNEFCRDEVIGDHAYDIAAELGRVLRIKLDEAMNVLDPNWSWDGEGGQATAELATDYLITFRNFSIAEVRSMLDIMDTQFGGDGELGPSEVRPPMWRQNYRSNHDNTELTILFYQLLQDMGLGEDDFQISTEDRRSFTIARLR